MQHLAFLNTSKRRIIFTIAALLLIAVTVFVVGAPNLNRPQTCSTSIPIDQDVQASLAYGAAFEPETWKEDYANHADSVSARWIDDTGLAHVDYLRYNCGLTSADLDQYRFDISLSGYEHWERTAQCEADGIRLHEFNIIYTGQDYRTRFWLQPVSDTRLVALQLTFPATRQSDMDKYAARLFPQLASCETISPT